MSATATVSLRDQGQSGMRRLAKLAYDQFGLDLSAGKEGLVTSRLDKKMQARGLRSLDEYCDAIEHDSTGESLIELIDALTTNHTSFFRENQHFDFLRGTVFPQWRGRRDVQIWSAACSSGEEPYTLAIILAEHFGGAGSILATDISTRVLESAQRGLYRRESFSQPLDRWLAKYLLNGKNKWDGWYRIRPELQKMIRFDRVNLVQPLPALGPFAAIFCRNVMIYFDRPTQEGVVNRLAERLEPGGYLFIGHAESLSGIQHNLDYVCPATYRRPVSKERK